MGGKTGNLHDDVNVAVEADTRVVVTATIPFSKRYLLLKNTNLFSTQIFEVFDKEILEVRNFERILVCSLQ